MRIAIVTVGTLGEVAPYIALGQGLAAAGDEVKLVTFRQFEQFVRSYRLQFEPIEGDLEELMNRDWTQSQIAKGSSLQALRHMSQVSHITQQMLEQLMIVCLSACADAELIIGQAVGHLAAQPVAQKLGIPYYAAYLYPLDRTRAFPNSFSLFPSGPGWYSWGKGLYNRWTHTLSTSIFWSLLRPIRQRAELAVLGFVPTSTAIPTSVLYGYSPTILPKPVEWRSQITVTGYWFLKQTTEWSSPSDLLAFLAVGSAPVYIGFGSMTGQAAKKVIRQAVQAVHNLQLRCIILADKTEWPEFQNQEHIFIVSSVSHEWLFPQIAVIIHHGGAGTTAAALQAGVPQIIVPFIADQSFWGHLIAARQLGPRPLKHKKLRLSQLQQTLASTVNDPGMRQRALALSEQIRAEDGVARAVETLHVSLHAEQKILQR